MDLNRYTKLKKQHFDLEEYLDPRLFKAIVKRPPEWTNFILVLIEKLLISYRPEGVILWLNRKRSILKGKTPSQIIRRALNLKGARIIMKLAEDLESNLDPFAFWADDSQVTSPTPWLQACQ